MVTFEEWEVIKLAAGKFLNNRICMLHFFDG